LLICRSENFRNFASSFVVIRPLCVIVVVELYDLLMDSILDHDIQFFQIIVKGDCL
jgi:uncharacterized membrane protein (DUF373 family)